MKVVKKGLLKNLIDSDGISGNEGKIRSIIRKEIEKYVDSVKVDHMGNLIAYKNGKKPTVMVAAHMDEICLIVKRIDKDGGIHISNVGGIEPVALLSQRVMLENGIRGVISTKELSDDLEIEEIPELDELIVDTGISKKGLGENNE